MMLERPKARARCNRASAQARDPEPAPLDLAAARSDQQPDPRRRALLPPRNPPYLRDVYDHTVHAIESLEANRDVIAGMLDIYLSAVSNRVNQEVRALTVVAIIFMPATLISGIFGMNFKHHAAARPAHRLPSSPSA
jgi:Mg2+ and Co2+ transporter CorA